MKITGESKKWPSFPQKGKTLRFYHETLFAPARLSNMSASTILHYDLNLKRFDIFLGRAAKLSDLNDQTVGQLGAWIQKAHGLSPSTAEKLQDCIVSLWRFLFNRGLVPVAPTIRKVRAPKRTPIAWRPEELERIWQFLERLPGEIDGIPANVWWQSLYAVLWSTGERIGAVLQTVWSDVDLTGGWIVVRPETRKGGVRDKLSRLHPHTVALLRQAVEPQRALVWPWPYSRFYLWQLHGDILRRAGVTADRYHSFHILRKSVASYTKFAGGNAQQVLGHSDGRMTEDNYIDPRIAPNQQSADVLPPISDIVKWRRGKDAS